MEKMTKDNYLELLKKEQPNIELLDDYKNADTSMRFRCKKCGNEYKYKLRTIRKGCPFCNNTRTHKLSNNEYQQRLKQETNGQIIAIDEYVDMNTKIKHKCLIHDVIWEVRPSAILGKGRRCPLCAEELHSKAMEKRKLNIDDIQKRIDNIFDDNYLILPQKYINNSSPLKCVHIIDDIEHEFTTTANAILSGEGCGVCRGLQVCVGYNDLNTTNPELANLLFDKNDGELVTESSGKILRWKCPDCGNIIKKSPAQVKRSGLACPICSDGISYPNKFMYCILKEQKLDYLKKEYKPSWLLFEMNGEIRSGRYDFHFIKDNIKYLVEMDGGLGHGIKSTSEFSVEETKFIDDEKDRLAKENGFIIIRIDCNYKHIENRYEYIKNNVLKSELKNILNFNNIDFDKINKLSMQSDLIEVCDLWNEGKSIKQISDITGIEWYSTITSYLKTGTKNGICNYSPAESKIRSFGHAVKCLNTGEVFRTIVDAAKSVGIDPSTVSKNCRNVTDYGGYDKNGNPLHWEYC